MTNKFGLKYLVILVVCTFLCSQQKNLLTQKLDIEKALHDKVKSAVTPLLDHGKFWIIVNVEFSTIGGTLKKTADPQSGEGSTENPLYYLGLPTTPDANGSANGSTTNNLSNQNIGRVDVTIGMDETSVTATIKQDLRSLVEKIVPQTKDCEDCIKIESRQFPSDIKNERLKDLEKKIDKLEADKRRADLAADSIRLENLENQLTEATTARTAWEAMENLRDLQALEQDSIRFVNLVNAELERRKQDSIKFVNTESRLERVMESKIKSDSVIIHEALSIVKQQSGNDNGSFLGGQGSGIMSPVIFILLIICLMVVTFLAANNKKPKTVYLKPKDKKKDDKKGGDDAEDKDAKNDDNADKPKAPPPPPPPRPDEDAMRSELKSLRQTAVSLTVGEKEGASALIKEWLEDNPNKEEKGEEEAGEE